jgi:hypothetical protein
LSSQSRARARRAPEAVPVTAEARITTVAIDQLVFDGGNVRRRDDRARSALSASLKQFGPARSIVLDGRDIVRAGNGTLEAFAAEGGTEVLIVEPRPGQLVAVKRADWSPTEATGYSIGDNRTTDLGAFDETALAEQLRALQSEQFDLASVGYTDHEVDDLLARLGTAAIDKAGPADFPEKDESISTDHECPKCGYVWSGKPG